MAICVLCSMSPRIGSPASLSTKHTPASHTPASQRIRWMRPMCQPTPWHICQGSVELSLVRLGPGYRWWLRWVAWVPCFFLVPCLSVPSVSRGYGSLSLPVARVGWTLTVTMMHTSNALKNEMVVLAAVQCERRKLPKNTADCGDKKWFFKVWKHWNSLHFNI